MVLADARQSRRPWTAEQLSRAVSAATDAVAGVPAVVSAYLFGSACRPGLVGDIDVAILVTAGADVSIRDLGRVARAIETAVGPGSPEVDVRVIRPYMAALAHEVRKTGILVYESDPAERARHEARMENRYLDEKWLHALARGR